MVGLWLLGLFAFGAPSPEITPPAPCGEPLEVVGEMLHAIGEAQTLSFAIRSWERFGDRTVYTRHEVRMQAEPSKVYMKMYEPDEGIEVLYVEGERNGKALVYPAGFPYVNVRLDPRGRLMRRDQHHTLFESGFRYMADIVRASLAFGGDRAAEYVRVECGMVVDGRVVDRLVIDNPDFAWVEHRVSPGESTSGTCSTRWRSTPTSGPQRSRSTAGAADSEHPQTSTIHPNRSGTRPYRMSSSTSLMRSERVHRDGSKAISRSW